MGQLVLSLGLHDRFQDPRALSFSLTLGGLQTSGDTSDFYLWLHENLDRIKFPATTRQQIQQYARIFDVFGAQLAAG